MDVLQDNTGKNGLPSGNQHGPLHERRQKLLSEGSNTEAGGNRRGRHLKQSGSHLNCEFQAKPAPQLCPEVGTHPVYGEGHPLGQRRAPSPPVLRSCRQLRPSSMSAIDGVDLTRPLVCHCCRAAKCQRLTKENLRPLGGWHLMSCFSRPLCPQSR